MRLCREDGIVSGHDALVGIGGDRELAATLCHRKFLELFDVVMGNPDDRRAEGFVVVDRRSEIMRFARAAFGEGGRIEVEDYRTATRR